MSHQNGAVVVRGDRLPEFKTIEQWGAGLKWLVGFHRQWKWVLGEYLVRGEEIYNEKIWQFIDPKDIGLKSRQDVSNAMYVYRACREQYTPAIEEWTFWQSMAPLTPKQRDECITRALSDEGISRDEIRALKSQSNGSGPPSNAEHGNPAADVPDAKSVAAQCLAEQIIVVGRLLRGSKDDSALSEALDELIAAAMELRAKLGR